MSEEEKESEKEGANEEPERIDPPLVVDAFPYPTGSTGDKPGAPIDYLLYPLERTTQLTLATGFIRDVKPVSLLVAAPPDQGKSHALELFSKAENGYKFNLATKWGVITEIREQLRLGGYVSHIIVPDFTVLIAGAPNVVKEVKSLISVLTEEGLDRQAAYFTKFDAKEFKDRLPWGNLKLGFLLAMTKKDLEDKRRNFNSEGFLSRFVPFSYQYSKEKQNQVFQDIVKQVPFRRFESATMNLKPGTEIEWDGDLYLKSKLARRRSNRWTISMRILAKAAALTNGRRKVIEDDLKEIEYLSHYFNLDYNELTDTPWTDYEDSGDPFDPWADEECRP